MLLHDVLTVLPDAALMAEYRTKFPDMVVDPAEMYMAEVGRLNRADPVMPLYETPDSADLELLSALSCSMQSDGCYVLHPLYLRHAQLRLFLSHPSMVQQCGVRAGAVWSVSCAAVTELMDCALNCLVVNRCVGGLLLFRSDMVTFTDEPNTPYYDESCAASIYHGPDAVFARDGDERTARFLMGHPRPGETGIGWRELVATNVYRAVGAADLALLLSILLDVVLLLDRAQGWLDQRSITALVAAAQPNGPAYAPVSMPYGLWLWVVASLDDKVHLSDMLSNTRQISGNSVSEKQDAHVSCLVAALACQVQRALLLKDRQEIAT
jgi:hypothetical protein